jgi:hypothetical protein
MEVTPGGLMRKGLLRRSAMVVLKAVRVIVLGGSSRWMRTWSSLNRS